MFLLQNVVIKIDGSVRSGSIHVLQSRYIVYLRRYMKYFKRKQIHVVDGDTLIENPLPELRKIENFIGKNHHFNETNVYFDKSKGFYCVKKQGKGNCLGANKGRAHPTVDNKVIQKLKKYLSSFNNNFHHAVGQNFDW